MYFVINTFQFAFFLEISNSHFKSFRKENGDSLHGHNK